MTIDEAARRTSISKDMIRHYEKIGLIKPKRRENRYRDFTEDDLNTLVLIRMLSSSHIPLRAIQRAFLQDSAEGLLPAYEAELERVRRLQRQLRAQEIALRVGLDCLRQCAAGGAPRRCGYPDRWVIWRSDFPGDAFDREQQAVIEGGGYFHYLAALELALVDGRIEQRANDRGLLLYSPHPAAEHLPAQESLRVVLTHAPGRELTADDLEPYVQGLARETGGTAYRALCYQIFHRMGDAELCFVCAELLHGGPS